MKPGKYKLTIYQGATLSLPLTWRLSGGAVTDLVGCTARMQVRPTVDSEDVLLSLTTENNGIVLAATAPNLVLQMSAAQTAALTWRAGVYDLEVAFPNGVVRRLLEGGAAVSPEVTRD
jgi:hypothetical protein